LKKTKKLIFRDEGVSPVIGVILVVAITVVVASILYVWVMNMASDTDKTVVEPLQVTPELNIDHENDELELKIKIGRGINWDNYRVMLNNSEVKTTPGKISLEGETVLFDYQGDKLIENKFYTLDIIEISTNTIVFSENVLAISDPSKVTKITGKIVSSNENLVIPGATIILYQNDNVINQTTSDIDGNYEVRIDEGTYEIVCIFDPLLQGMFGKKFYNHSGEITLIKYEKVVYDIALYPILEETSLVFGNVYDNSTSLPLSNVKVKISDYKNINKDTITDMNGYYEFSLPGLNVTISFSLNGYQLSKTDLTIEDNETITYDTYLDKIPAQTASVSGNVYDKKTNAPLENVKVYTVSQYTTNHTTTDENGSFKINVVPGSLTVFINTVYYKYWEQEITVIDDENYLLLPIYLEQEPGVG
jgi:flagellin-like protein